MRERTRPASGLGREKLDVVDEKQIDALAVARAELVHLLILQRLHELVDELLGRDVEDAGVRSLGAKLVGDGVDEVGLSEPGPPADEERVVPASAASSGGDGRGVRQLVRRANDEVREGVLRVQPFDGQRRDLNDAARRARGRRGLVRLVLSGG